ncbi:hypothetical protein Ple7327_4627 [Pleurocapsa sp. PCC 7327]|nr:hypothetical protein Ple7327_4627 [Pleurocapsa sp. PCC 7327]
MTLKALKIQDLESVLQIDFPHKTKTIFMGSQLLFSKKSIEYFFF